MKRPASRANEMAGLVVNSALSEPKMWILYAIIGISATAYSLWLTGYSAALNLEHYQGMLRYIGPSASIGACLALCYAEIGWRAGKVKALVIGAVGLVALVASGVVIMDRVASTQQASIQAARDSNLPKVQAERALEDAKAELKAASDQVNLARKDGRCRQCPALTRTESEARARVDAARAKVVTAGAMAEVDPGAATISTVFGISPELYRRSLPLLLPAWLEIAAPVFGLFGVHMLMAAFGRPVPVADGTMAPRASRVPAAPHGTAPSAPARRARKRKAKGANGATGTKRGTNSRAYILERLERIGRHDLARAVLAKEMSAAAAADAGFRNLKVVA
jgi:hypothetical protein